MNKFKTLQVLAACIVALTAGCVAQTHVVHIPIDREAVLAEIDRENLRHDRVVFDAAYNLTQKGKYAEAVLLFEDNIAKHPNAGNIDYDYGWAMYCHAKLGNLEKAVEYYKLISERFPGWQHYGSDGAHRRWDRKQADVRKMIQESSSPDRRVLLRRLDTIDREARIVAEQTTAN